MLTASQYISTGKTSIYDRNVSSEGFTTATGITYYTSTSYFISYVQNSGLTYISPFMSLPESFLSPTKFSSFANSNTIKFVADVFKVLPKGKRAIQNFNSYVYTNAWVADKITISSKSFVGYTGVSWGTQTVTNSYYSPWPTVGISATHDMFMSALNFLSSQGTTLDCLMLDAEITPYNDGYVTSSLWTQLKGYTQYYLPWNGLTSMDELYKMFGAPGVPSSYPSSWWPVQYGYQGKAFQLAYVPALLKHNPDGIVSNYKYIQEDYVPITEEVNYVWSEDGYRLPSMVMGGNANCPELYGAMRQIVGDSIVNPFEGTKLDLGVKTNYFNSLNKTIKAGPWASFMLNMAEARAAKRGNPSAPLNPWIGSVDWYGPSYISSSLRYPMDSSQSPAKVLDDTWYKNNTSLTKGFWGPSGFTSTSGYSAAFRVLTSLNGPTGITYGSVAYYSNKITHGLTYIFSYDVYLNEGLTSPDLCVQTVNYFKNWTYLYPIGITFERILPSGSSQYNGYTYTDYSGYSGWTRVSYKFYTQKPFDDISDNTAVAISIFGCSGATTAVSNKIAYFAYPTLEIESSPNNIPISLRDPLDEYHYIEHYPAPPTGFADLPILGYNPRQGFYVTETPGHSGYYYEMVKQLCLIGTKAFGYFNPSQFVNYGFTGSLAEWNRIGRGSNDYFYTDSIPLKAGWTGYLADQKTFDNCIHDVQNKIGGFTLTTADYSPVDWNSVYFANGAPGLNGTTWWWRVTVKPGITMICNGITLSSALGYPVGTWVSTTGPTLAGVPITWTEWPTFNTEPGYTAPTKDVNMEGMTGLASLVAAGATFVRNSQGTYINSNGILTIAATGAPRFDYDPVTKQFKGLLLENATQNRLNWSESFAATGGNSNNWTDTKLSRSSGNTSPAGTTNAIRFTATEGNATLISTAPVTGMCMSSWSCWFRGITGNENISVTVDGGTSWSTITGLSTGWLRFGTSNTRYVLGLTQQNIHLGFKLGNTNDSVEIWGAQVEYRTTVRFGTKLLDPYGAVPFTSYIPTGASGGSRAAEKFLFTGTGFTSWFSNTNGTFLFETTNAYQIHIATILTTNTNALEYYCSSDGSVQFWRRNITPTPLAVSNTLMNYKYPTSGYPLNIPLKTICTYAPHGLKISNNGNLGYSTYTGQTLSFTAYIGINFTLASGAVYDTPPSPYHLKRFRYWNYVWDDDSMKQMTLAGITQTTTFNPYG